MRQYHPYYSEQFNASTRPLYGTDSPYIFDVTWNIIIQDPKGQQVSIGTHSSLDKDTVIMSGPGWEQVTRRSAAKEYFVLARRKFGFTRVA